MTKKNKTDVFIGGRNFTVIGDESSEYVYKLAAYVDEKIKDMTSKNDKLSESMAAILAALNIADGLHKMARELNLLKEQSRTPIKEYDILVKQLKVANNEVEELGNKYNKYRDELTDIKRQYKQLNGNNEKNIQALKAKEKELRDSRNMVRRLQDKIFDNQVQLVETKKELEEMLKLYDKEKSIFNREEV